MGTPEFSVPMLDSIYNSKYDLVGVVTVEDKPAGRGRKISKSAVKQYVEDKNITVLQPKNLKSEDFLNELKILNPNLIIVVAFRMLPKQVWSYPEYGTFNLHASLLPQYRGAAPINWAIINGETKTGLTTFFIDEKIDTGEIIDSVEIEIKDEENLEDIYNKMLPKGSDLIMKTISLIEKNITTAKKQENPDHLKKAPKLSNENTKIDWDQSAKSIFDFVRGLSPYPLAWSTIKRGEEKILCKISKVRYEFRDHKLENGRIEIRDKSLFVAAGDGFVEILEIKLSGKKLLKTKDLLNGFELGSGSRMLW